jgi:hypothetical protein
MFADLNDKSSLTLYRQVKGEWGKEGYIEKCTKKERIVVIWWKAGIWKLKGIRGDFEKGRCPLCGGDEDEKHILLKCKESKKWREEWTKSNWLSMNEILVYRKRIGCMDANKTKLLGNYLFKVKCKWEHKVKGDVNSSPPTDM